MLLHKATREANATKNGMNIIYRRELFVQPSLPPIIPSCEQCCKISRNILAQNIFVKYFTKYWRKFNTFDDGLHSAEAVVDWLTSFLWHPEAYMKNNK